MRTALSIITLAVAALPTTSFATETDSATEALSRIRSGSDMPIVDLIIIEHNLERTGRTLSDIGTTESGVMTIKVNAYIQRSHKYLARLRKGSNMPNVDVTSLYSWLEHAGLYPEDIGTSADEIDSFKS